MWNRTPINEALPALDGPQRATARLANIERQSGQALVSTQSATNRVGLPDVGPIRPADHKATLARHAVLIIGAALIGKLNVDQLRDGSTLAHECVRIALRRGQAVHPELAAKHSRVRQAELALKAVLGEDVAEPDAALRDEGKVSMPVQLEKIFFKLPRPRGSMRRQAARFVECCQIAFAAQDAESGEEGLRMMKRVGQHDL